MATMELGLSTPHAELSDSSSCVTAVRGEWTETVSTCMSLILPHLHSTSTFSGGRYSGEQAPFEGSFVLRLSNQLASDMLSYTFSPDGA